MSLHSIEVTMVINNRGWCGGIGEEQSNSLEDESILKEALISKVVISRVLLSLVINQLITESVDWELSIYPGEEIIICDVLVWDLIVIFGFRWHLDGGVGALRRVLFMIVVSTWGSESSHSELKVL